MPRFEMDNVEINDLIIVKRQMLLDNRGYFSRLFCKDELSLIGWNSEIAQINHSYTIKKGTIRGLHYQVHPHSEIKLVSCIKGAIWDVAVDLRVGSPTFLKWHAVELSDSNQRALLIPEGFAHGFQTLTDECEIIYIHSKKHMPNAEAGINVSDTLLRITWPNVFTEISERDALLPFLDNNFKGIKL